MVSTREHRLETTEPSLDRITILGAGAWGTTLGLVAHRAGRQVTLVARRADLAAHLDVHRSHPTSLDGVTIPRGIAVTADAGAAIDWANAVVVAVPAQSLRSAIVPYRAAMVDKPLISAVKGLELGTLLRPTDVLTDILGSGPALRLAALSGPNLAAEVAAGKPTATVVASASAGLAVACQRALTSPTFRVYTASDVIGAEMGGALKNIIAIGAGIGDGMGAGDNAKAAFLTRGITEIGRLGVACGANAGTFAGLTGIGDLIATCASDLSRNHRVGQALARGQELDEILSTMGEVAEGVPTTEAAHRLGRRLAVELPIIDQMYAVLFQGKAPLAALAELMDREPVREMPASAP